MLISIIYQTHFLAYSTLRCHLRPLIVELANQKGDWEILSKLIN